MVNNYTPYTSPPDSAETLANALFTTPSGIAYVPGSATFTGDQEAVSFFDSISIGTALLGSGILLTSGDGTPPLLNTETNYSDANGLPGDADLDAAVQAAFPGAGTTEDASILTFNVNVTDTAIKSISFDLVFGSDEYPEFSNTSFVDIAGVFVNGLNRAFFGNSASRPLSILDDNLAYFQDNQGGGLAIEYDGISHKLTIHAPVNQGLNTIKIAIADTGDSIYDSGLYISNIQGSTVAASGVVFTITGSDLVDHLVGGTLDEFFNALGGNDTVKAKGGNDILNGGTGKDLLDGGLGFDIFIGGQGGDDFDFNKFADSSKKLSLADVIQDFKHGQDDLNVASLPGTFAFVGTGPFTGNGPEIRFQQHNKPGTDNDFTAILVDKDGNTSVDFAVKLLGLVNITAIDFDL